MRHEMAMTTNLRRFLAAVRELIDRPYGVEGMGLLWGETGEGKTKSIAYANGAIGALYVEVGAAWTPRVLAEALIFECGQPMGRSAAAMIAAVIKDLVKHPRPVFFDEAERLLEIKHGLEIAREIYDKSSSPVILAGTQELCQKVSIVPAMERRITQIVRFNGISWEDAKIVADTICEVHLENELLERVYDAAFKNIGRMLTSFSNIERFAKTNKIDSVTSKLWGDRIFYPGQIPFKKRRRR